MKSIISLPLTAAVMLGITGAASDNPPPSAGSRPVAVTAQPASEKMKPAKSVIEIWVWGGPSHLDTFDPKPGAPREYNGGYGEIPTNVPGITVSEFLPKLARQADKFSIIRSMTHGINAHETATYLMQTGRMPGGGVTYPAIGAVIAMLKSRDYHGKLPPYIALVINKGRFSENGFLAERYRPLATGGNPNAERFQVDGFVPPGNFSEEQLLRRNQLARDLDRMGREMSGHPVLDEFDAAGEDAWNVMQSNDVKAFDLSQETPEMRDKYGRNFLGQAFLVARRLVQVGVPYITINAPGWDSHKRHFETMKQRTAEMDQAFAALLEDLAEKDLLDTTLIWWTGEFGRTPKIDWQEPWMGGRNHHGKVFSTVLAGGGIKGGVVVGSSDALGIGPASRPVTPGNLLWSLYELAGIDPAGKLPNPKGLDITILPLEGRDGRLVELYKDPEYKP